MKKSAAKCFAGLALVAALSAVSVGPAQAKDSGWGFTSTTTSSTVTPAKDSGWGFTSITPATTSKDSGWG